MDIEKVICSTPEEFSRECTKWAGKSVIRGRKLYAYGEVVAELSNTHGGARKGSGRKQNDRNYPISVKISAEAKAVLDRQANKAEYIDNLLKQQTNV